MTENTTYYNTFIKEDEITGFDTLFEVRYYQYNLNGFMIEEPIIEEMEEYENELEMMIEFMKQLKILMDDPNKHFYIWANKNEYVENKEGESDLSSSEILLYLTNDDARIKKPKMTLYNHH
jgi:hypothetical protein